MNKKPKEAPQEEKKGLAEGFSRRRTMWDKIVITRQATGDPELLETGPQQDNGGNPPHKDVEPMELD